MDGDLFTVTPGLDGLRLWVDGAVVAEPATLSEARAAYRAALALATEAGEQLNRTLERV